MLEKGTLSTRGGRGGGHTDPELQAIVQGLEVSSPSFRAIFGVLFCDYDVSQGLRG